jgi:hypothetical protein
MMKALTRDQIKMTQMVAWANEGNGKRFNVVAEFTLHKEYGFEVSLTKQYVSGIPEDAMFTEAPSLCSTDDVTVYWRYYSEGSEWSGGSVNIFWEDSVWFEQDIEDGDYYSMVYNHTNREWFFYPLLREVLVDIPEPSKVLDYEECEVIETSLTAS